MFYQMFYQIKQTERRFKTLKVRLRIWQKLAKWGMIHCGSLPQVDRSQVSALHLTVAVKIAHKVYQSVISFIKVC